MRGVQGTAVVFGDGERPPLIGGALVFDDAGVLLAVGDGDSLRRANPSARWEQHGAVLTPGLVNAHTHLELSALRGRCPGGDGFGPWVTAMIAAREQAPPERDDAAIAAGVAELLQAGTVAVGEVTNSLATVPQLAAAPLIGRVFHEVFGMRAETGVAVLAAAREARARLAESTEWPGHLSYTLSPHTPFSMNPQLMRDTLDAGRQGGARMSLHLAEHAAERAFLRDGTGPFRDFLTSRDASEPDWPAPGMDPVGYADALGALAQDVIAVHLADARAGELALVAERGAPVVLCPRSNRHIEAKLPPLDQILEAGLQPGLGTDSLASAPSLDVLEEARALRAGFGNVPCRTLIAMATGWGAAALGLDEHVGDFVVGRGPGVVAFACPNGAPGDPEAFVLDALEAKRDVPLRAPLPSELAP